MENVGISERGFPRDVAGWGFGGATGERGFPRDVAFTSDRFKYVGVVWDTNSIHLWRVFYIEGLSG